MNRINMWRSIEAHPKAWDMIVVGGGATGVGGGGSVFTAGFGGCASFSGNGGTPASANRARGACAGPGAAP